MRSCWRQMSGSWQALVRLQRCRVPTAMEGAVFVDCPAAHCAVEWMLADRLVGRQLMACWMVHLASIATEACCVACSAGACCGARRGGCCRRRRTAAAGAACHCAVGAGEQRALLHLLVLHSQAPARDAVVVSWACPYLSALLQCSRCEKWRRLSDEAHAAIAADAEWFCEQNPDPAFASCEVPQEAEE